MVGNPKKELSLSECKALELDILKHIRDICDAEGLHYYLAYGTLLGAIRHKGFIPWDDDIDIFMPYEDYLKFIEIKKNDSSSSYKIISHETDPSYTAPLGKVIDTRTVLEQHYGFIEKVPLGVYVDVFVLSGAGNSEGEALKLVRSLFKLLRGWRFADSIVKKEEPLIKKVLKMIRNIPYKTVGLEHYLEKITEYRKLNTYENNIYVTQSSLTSVNNVKRNIWLRNDFGNGTKVVFEQESFRAPVNYNRLLTQYYGDYMILPPKEAQVSQHNYSVYWA